VAGRTREGVALLEEAHAALDSVGAQRLRSRFLQYLGEAYLLAGRLEDALRVADQALRVARRRGERGYEAWTLRLHGEIHSRRDPFEFGVAEESYRLALGLADRLGMRPLSAHCHLGLGRLYRRTEKPEGDAHLRSAIALYREVDMPFWLEKARAESDVSSHRRRADAALGSNGSGGAA